MNPLIPIRLWDVPFEVTKEGLFRACCLLTDVVDLIEGLPEDPEDVGKN